MNLTRLATSTACISLCSLALSNCSTIKNYRKHPSEWKNSNTRYSQEKTPDASAPKTEKKAPPATANTTTPAPRPVTQPRYVSKPRANTRTLPLVAETPRKEAARANKSQRRRSNGLLMPDADKLPTKKDLQEVQSPMRRKNKPSGVNLPIQP